MWKKWLVDGKCDDDNDWYDGGCKVILTCVVVHGSINLGLLLSKLIAQWPDM